MKQLETIRTIRTLLEDLEDQIIYRAEREKVVKAATERANKLAKQDDGTVTTWWRYYCVPDKFNRTPVTQTSIRRRATIMRELLLQLYEEDDS